MQLQQDYRLQELIVKNLALTPAIVEDLIKILQFNFCFLKIISFQRVTDTFALASLSLSSLFALTSFEINSCDFSAPAFAAMLESLPRWTLALSLFNITVNDTENVEFSLPPDIEELRLKSCSFGILENGLVHAISALPQLKLLVEVNSNITNSSNYFINSTLESLQLKSPEIPIDKIVTLSLLQLIFFSECNLHEISEKVFSLFFDLNSKLTFASINDCQVNEKEFSSCFQNWLLAKEFILDFILEFNTGLYVSLNFPETNVAFELHMDCSCKKRNGCACFRFNEMLALSSPNFALEHPEAKVQFYAKINSAETVNKFIPSIIQFLTFNSFNMIISKIKTDFFSREEINFECDEKFFSHLNPTFQQAVNEAFTEKKFIKTQQKPKKHINKSKKKD